MQATSGSRKLPEPPGPPPGPRRGPRTTEPWGSGTAHRVGLFALEEGAQGRREQGLSAPHTGGTGVTLSPMFWVGNWLRTSESRVCQRPHFEVQRRLPGKC